MLHRALVLLIALFGLLSCCNYDQQNISTVTAQDKAEFFKLVRTLPTAGEFYSVSAYPIATPYLHVLLALDMNDVGMDLYPYVVLSRLLHNVSIQNRRFAARQFAEIRHEWIRMFWAILLFKYSSECTPKIVNYLKDSLDGQRAELLQACAGPDFDNIRKRIREARIVK